MKNQKTAAPTVIKSAFSRLMNVLGLETVVYAQSCPTGACTGCHVRIYDGSCGANCFSNNGTYPIVQTSGPAQAGFDSSGKANETSKALFALAVFAAINLVCAASSAKLVWQSDGH